MSSPPQTLSVLWVSEAPSLGCSPFLIFAVSSLLGRDPSGHSPLVSPCARAGTAAGGCCLPKRLPVPVPVPKLPVPRLPPRRCCRARSLRAAPSPPCAAGRCSRRPHGPDSGGLDSPRTALPAAGAGPGAAWPGSHRSPRALPRRAAAAKVRGLVLSFLMLVKRERGMCGADSSRLAAPKERLCVCREAGAWLCSLTATQAGRGGDAAQQRWWEY